MILDIIKGTENRGFFAQNTNCNLEAKEEAEAAAFEQHLRPQSRELRGHRKWHSFSFPSLFM